MYGDENFKRFDDNLIDQCQRIMSLHLTTLGTGTYKDKMNQKMNEKIVEIFKEWKSKDAKNRLKAVLMFTHDSSILPFYNNFQPNNWKCSLENYLNKYEDSSKHQFDNNCIDMIRFTANLLFEVYEDNSEWFISLKYNNEKIRLIGNSNFIKLDEFIKILEDNSKSQEWSKICRKIKPYKNIPSWMMILSITLFSIVVILCGVIIMKKNEIDKDASKVYEAI